jgi:hypothetical protein
MMGVCENIRERCGHVSHPWRGRPYTAQVGQTGLLISWSPAQIANHPSWDQIYAEAYIFLFYVSSCPETNITTYATHSCRACCCEVSVVTSARNSSSKKHNNSIVTVAHDDTTDSQYYIHTAGDVLHPWGDASLRVEVQISISRLSTFEERPTPDCRLWFETNSWLSTVVWDHSWLSTVRSKGKKTSTVVNSRQFSTGDFSTSFWRVLIVFRVFYTK